MIQSQSIQEGLSDNGDYLLQKKIEVMLDLQYKRIKGDIETLREAVEKLAQEIEGLKNGIKTASQNYSQPVNTLSQTQGPMPQQNQQPHPYPQQYQKQQFQQASPPPTSSSAQQAYQQNLTSEDVSIEKFFSFGKKR
ncbi:MAG: hypothetical protein QXK37_03535 [Candidatus Woesearchaeota archaeon]